MSEIINGYELSAPFQNENAGFSRWTFAVKDKREFFLKEFLDPVYPDDQTLSESLRRRKIADCTAYEEKKRKLYEAINRAAGGNLIRIEEFFRSGSHYYIETEKVKEERITIDEIADMPWKTRLILCRGLAYSLKCLHEQGIVHADIKETNVLVKRSLTGQIVEKVIDFDCAFFEDDPPTEDELGGDQVYLSPEACKFLCGEPEELSGRMDVFALGILFHQYLTGEIPGFNADEYDYVHEAVLDDQKLQISGKLPEPTANLIRQMLECKPEKRVTSEEVFEQLGVILFGENEETKKKRAKAEEKKASDFFFAPGGDL